MSQWARLCPYTLCNPGHDITRRKTKFNVFIFDSDKIFHDISSFVYLAAHYVILLNLEDRAET